MNEQQLKALIETEQRSIHNAEAIEQMMHKIEDNNKIASSVETLAVEIKYMREDQQKLAKLHSDEVKMLDTRLSTIEKKPGNDFEKIKWIIITRYSFGFTGFFIRSNRIIEVII